MLLCSGKVRGLQLNIRRGTIFYSIIFVGSSEMRIFPGQPKEVDGVVPGFFGRPTNQLLFCLGRAVPSRNIYIYLGYLAKCMSHRGRGSNIGRLTQLSGSL